MPLYYFHLRNGEDILLDEDGRELLSMREIEVAALQEARAIISHDALQGRIDLAYHIDVQDRSGETLHSLRFRDAVNIAGN